jgi:hypothetical protein
MARKSFSPGRHSFWGAVKLTVLEGVCQIHGALLKPGVSEEIYFPFHGLPGFFFSDQEVVLELEEIPRESFVPTEIQFYYAESVDNYERIFPNLFH